MKIIKIILTKSHKETKEFIFNDDTYVLNDNDSKKIHTSLDEFTFNKGEKIILPLDKGSLTILPEISTEVSSFQETNPEYKDVSIEIYEAKEVGGVIIDSKKKKLTTKRKKELIFIFIMLLYPLAQFLLTWIFVNSNSIIIAFQNISLEGEVSFAGFENFAVVFRELFNKDLKPVVIANGMTIPSGLMILINSLLYGFITIFISLPLALISSYFLSKKMPLANVFRVIFFLPNIISVVALIYAFKTQIAPDTGVIGHLFELMGIKINDSVWPNTTIIVLCYCVWAGLGYNVLLMSGAIGRIPKELFESAEMDGAGNWKEFTKIMIPMIWPTVVTLLVLGMTSILTLYLQPVLFNYDRTETIAGVIFLGVKENGKNQYPVFSAFGLLYSFIFAPIVLLVRKFASKKYSDTDM